MKVSEIGCFCADKYDDVVSLSPTQCIEISDEFTAYHAIYLSSVPSNVLCALCAQFLLG